MSTLILAIVLSLPIGSSSTEPTPVTSTCMPVVGSDVVFSLNGTEHAAEVLAIHSTASGAQYIDLRYGETGATQVTVFFVAPEGSHPTRFWRCP